MKKQTTLCLLLLLFVAIHPMVAQHYTISGHITDRANGESLISLPFSTQFGEKAQAISVTTR